MEKQRTMGIRTKVTSFFFAIQIMSLICISSLAAKQVILQKEAAIPANDKEWISVERVPLLVPTIVLDKSPVIKNLRTQSFIEPTEDEPLLIPTITLQQWKTIIEPTLTLLSTTSNEVQQELAIEKLLQKNRPQEKKLSEYINFYASVVDDATTLNIHMLLVSAMLTIITIIKNNITEFAEHPEAFERLWELPSDVQHKISRHLGIIPHFLADVEKKENFNYGKDSPQFQHTGIVSSVAFHPKSQLVASGSYDSTILLVNTVDEKEGSVIKNPAGHTEQINAISFNADGTLFASASNDDTIKLWDTSSDSNTPPKLIATMRGHTDDVTSVAFNDHDASIASGSKDTTIKLWDIRNPENPILMTTIDTSNAGHTKNVNAVIFNRKGTLLLSGSSDGTIKIWSVKDRRHPSLISTIDSSISKITGEILTIALDPTEISLAAGSTDKTVTVFDISNPAKPSLKIIFNEKNKGHMSDVVSVAFHPKNDFLASGSKDNTIKLWDTFHPSHAHLIVTLDQNHRGHIATVKSIAFNNEGTLLVSSSADKTVKLWKIYEEPRTIKQGMLLYFAQSKGGILLSNYPQLMRIYDTFSEEEKDQMRDLILN
jgi:WD40 repeat protein